MSGYRGPLGRAMETEPVTARQLDRLTRLMVAVGVTVADERWPSTVRAVVAPTASPNPVSWSKAGASRMIDALENYQRVTR